MRPKLCITCFQGASNTQSITTAAWLPISMYYSLDHVLQSPWKLSAATILFHGKRNTRQEPHMYYKLQDNGTKVVLLARE